MVNIKKFHGAVQSKNVVLAGFKHVNLRREERELICLCKWQQLHVGLVYKKNLEKILIFRSLTVTLAKISSANSCTWNCTQKIFLLELFIPESVWTQLKTRSFGKWPIKSDLNTDSVNMVWNLAESRTLTQNGGWLFISG